MQQRAQLAHTLCQDLICLSSVKSDSSLDERFGKSLAVPMVAQDHFLHLRFRHPPVPPLQLSICIWVGLRLTFYLLIYLLGGHTQQC